MCETDSNGTFYTSDLSYKSSRTLSGCVLQTSNAKTTYWEEIMRHIKSNQDVQFSCKTGVVSGETHVYLHDVKINNRGLFQDKEF